VYDYHDHDSSDFFETKKGILASCGPAGRQSSVKAHNGVIDKVLDYDKDPIVGSLEVVMNMYKLQYIITKSSQISPTLGAANPKDQFSDVAP